MTAVGPPVRLLSRRANVADGQVIVTAGKYESAMGNRALTLV